MAVAGTVCPLDVHQYRQQKVLLLTPTHVLGRSRKSVLNMLNWVIARMCTRGFDFALGHEEACHNREQKGRTDGDRHLPARFNHAVDLTALQLPHQMHQMHCLRNHGESGQKQGLGLL